MRKEPDTTERNRRILLQGLAISLPVAWSRPVVETVVLPAHAATSPEDSGPVDCSAEAGCYTATEFDQAFLWPGGAGPASADNFEASDSCDGDPRGSFFLVVASDIDEAAERCPDGRVPEPFDTDPPPATGCGFFRCLLEDT